MSWAIEGQYNRVILIPKPWESLINCTLCRTGGQRSHQQKNTFRCQKGPFKILKQQHPWTCKNCPLLEQGNGKTCGPSSFLCKQKQQRLQLYIQYNSKVLKRQVEKNWLKDLPCLGRRYCGFLTQSHHCPRLVVFHSGPKITWGRSTHTRKGHQCMCPRGDLRKPRQWGWVRGGGRHLTTVDGDLAPRRHYWE